MDTPAMEILPYEPSAPRCDPYDEGASAAALRLIDYLRTHLAGASIEHIGSTAVPGCPGKGVLDLMVICEKGRLPDVRERIDALGFQRQTTRNPFPEERPMRTGAIEHVGRRYLVHLHLLPADSSEVEELRYFRDCLRADRELRAAYVAFKKKVLASGVKDSVEYAEAKGEFIRQCLGR